MTVVSRLTAVSLPVFITWRLNDQRTHALDSWLVVEFHYRLTRAGPGNLSRAECVVKRGRDVINAAS